MVLPPAAVTLVVVGRGVADRRGHRVRPTEPAAYRDRGMAAEMVIIAVITLQAAAVAILQPGQAAVPAVYQQQDKVVWEELAGTIVPYSAPEQVPAAGLLEEGAAQALHLEVQVVREEEEPAAAVAMVALVPPIPVAVAVALIHQAAAREAAAAVQGL